MASVLVGPMKRLLREGEITKEDVKKRVELGTISESDYKLITGEDYES